MEKKHILLIENNETEVEFFRNALEESKLEFLCTRARNIEQASKILRNIVPDIIFFDINMSSLSGAAFLEKIKTTTSLQKTSVIVYLTTVKQKKSKTVNSDSFPYFLLPRNVHTMANMLQNFVNESSDKV